MTTYARKTLEYNACQYDPNDFSFIINTMGALLQSNEQGVCIVQPVTGEMVPVPEGYWVVRLVNPFSNDDPFYVYSDDEFNYRYQANSE